MCVKPGTLALQEYDFKKVGRPPYHWWEKGLEQYWEYLHKHHLKCYAKENLNPNSKKHIEALKIAAERNWV